MKEKSLSRKIKDLYEMIGETKPRSAPSSHHIQIPDPEPIYQSDISPEDIGKVKEEDYDWDVMCSQKNETFHSKYNQVLFIYPKVHYANWDYYIAHIGPCSWVQSQNMKKNFLVSSRHDGFFPVFVETSKGRQLEIKRHVLCWRCYSEFGLSQRNYMGGDRFDFNRFYQEETHYSFLHRPLVDISDFHTIGTSDNDYAVNWHKLSRAIKENRGWQCEICHWKATTEEEKYYIEVHHRDKNPMNCNPSNLEVLCSRCHDKEHPNRPHKGDSQPR